MPILSVPCVIIKTTIHVKSSKNNMDKSKKIIWKNRGETKDVEDDDMQFPQNNNAVNVAIMTLH